MKALALGLLLSFTSQAAVIEGTIKKISSTVALETKNGIRLRLPHFIKAENGLLNKKVKFVADMMIVPCTDSAPIFSGVLVDVKEFSVVLSYLDVVMQSYTGMVKRYTGQAVESPRKYDYLAVDAGEPVAIPGFIDATALYEVSAQITIVGLPRFELCTDMSLACGPMNMETLGAVIVKLK